MAETLSFKEKVYRLQNSVRGIKKDKVNPHFQYKYISAQNVNETVKDALEELRLIVQQETSLVSFTDNVAICKTTLTLLDTDSDEFMVFSSVGSGTDKGDKMVMKAATASAKYGTVAMIFGASKDDPEADASTDKTEPSPKPASVRSNRPAITGQQVAAIQQGTPVKPLAPPAGSAAAAQGPVPVGDNGMMAVTVGVGEVYKGRPSKTKAGKFGPGTVLGTNGERYDTFDTGLLEIAKRAKEEGKNVNIIYAYDEQWKKNTIAEHGLGIFGEVAVDEAPTDEVATY